jgi:hypothetical protein
MATADAGRTGKSHPVAGRFGTAPSGALSKGGGIMFKAVAPILTGICLFLGVPLGASGEERAARALNSDLRVELLKGQPVPAKDGNIPVQLTFFNHTNKEQMFLNAEYRFAILDKDGRQVKGALVIIDEEARAIVLKGRSTTDTPPVYLESGKLKAGAEYFLVVSARDLIGHVKFTAQ